MVEKFEAAGQWLFRWRSYLPLALLAVVIPAMHGFSYPDGSQDYDRLWEVFCLFVSCIGLFIRAYTIGHAPRGTSGRNVANQLAERLNQTGIYSMCRNPLYLGNFFMILGVVSFVRVWWVDVIYALAFWLYYERIIAAEEAFLSEKFGATYADWKSRTPVFVPNPRLWKPNVLPFSLKTVLRREYPGFFAVIAAMTMLEVGGDYVISGRFEYDPMWVGLFFFGLVVYLVLRTLKKKTTLLDVEGR